MHNPTVICDPQSKAEGFADEAPAEDGCEEGACTFSGVKWVRLRADYEASGIWWKDGVLGTPEDLPIDKELRVRIHRLQEAYDLSPIEGPWSGHASFSEDGLRIALSLKAALLDWTVVYFDLHRRQQAREGGINERSFFKFEITSDLVAHSDEEK